MPYLSAGSSAGGPIVKLGPGARVLYSDGDVELQQGLSSMQDLLGVPLVTCIRVYAIIQNRV